MIPIPTDLSSLTVQQLRELIGSATQDIAASQGLDYMTATKRAKISYPQIWDELQRRSDALAAQGQQPIISNEDRYRIKQYTPSEESRNRLGLHPAATEDEFNAATKGAGKNLANPDYESAFSAVSDVVSSKRRVPSKEADAAVAARHPNLKRLADTQRIQRELQQSQPETNAGFQRTNSANKSLMTPPAPRTPNGLDAFKVGNQVDLDPKKWLENFDTPAKRKACVQSVAAYLGWKNDTDADEAEKTIPELVPHMSAVYDAYLKDCQQER